MTLGPALTATGLQPHGMKCCRDMWYTDRSRSRYTHIPAQLQVILQVIARALESRLVIEKLLELRAVCLLAVRQRGLCPCRISTSSIGTLTRSAFAVSGRSSSAVHIPHVLVIATRIDGCFRTVVAEFVSTVSECRMLVGFDAGHPRYDIVHGEAATGFLT